MCVYLVFENLLYLEKCFYFNWVTWMLHFDEKIRPIKKNLWENSIINLFIHFIIYLKQKVLR